MADDSMLGLRSSLKIPNSTRPRNFNVSFEDSYISNSTPLKSPNSCGHSHARNSPPDSISFLNGSSLEEVTSPDIDDLLPKTDYTYARTASYQKKYFNKVGSVSPNMSRRRVDGNSPIFISDDESEDGYEEEYDDEAVISQSRSFYAQDSKRRDSDENVKRRVSSMHRMGYTSTPLYPHDPHMISSHDHYYKGMLLRSGSHIKGVSARRGYNSSSSGSDALNHDATMGLVPTYRSDYEGRESRNDHVGSNKSWKTSKTTEYTTYEDEDDMDKEEMNEMGDSEMKLKLDESQSEKRKKQTMPYRLRNLDGLDMDDELSDVEHYESEEIYSRNRLNARSRWQGNQNENFFYSIIMTIITTIITTTTTAAASVVDVTTYTGSTLFHIVTTPFVWLWRVVVTSCSWIVTQATTMLLMEMESKRRRRRGCCLWVLPLLLLLPLALLAGHYARDSGVRHRVSGFVSQSESAISGMWAGLWAESPRRVVIPPPVAVASDGERQEMDMTQINNYIEQTVLQMFVERQQDIPPGLTSDQVKDIVQAMLATQMGSTKNEMDAHINSISGLLRDDFSSLRANLMAMQEQIHASNRDTQSVSSNLDATKASIQSMSREQRTEWLAASQALESKLLDLRNDVNELANKNTALVAMLKSCCQNNTALADTVRAHMVSILSELGNDDNTDSALAGLMGWMHENYVERAALDKKLSLVAKEITENLQAILTQRVSEEVQKNGDTGIRASIVAGSIDENLVKSIVEEALVQFSADRVGMPDFALESAGGSVLNVRCSETYYRKTALVSVFGIPLYYTSNSPRTVIQPNVHPGECWAFKGNSGFVVIQLSQPIQPTGFTLEHIPKMVAPSGNIDSAPKAFTILGLSAEGDAEGISMGNYTYADNGKPIQHFPVQNRHPGVFQYIELRVLSNHGNPEYTCIYRFRVHGLP